MNQTLYFALIGKDIGYSRSPDIFEAIYKQVGLPGRFEIHSMAAGELSTYLRQTVLDGVGGFSVTIPFKQEIIRFLDDIDPTSRAVDAVNSVAVVEGRLLGYNTDCHGFSEPLRAHRSLLKSGRALILGSGGGARAVIHVLHRDFDINRFVVAGRSPEKLEALIKFFQESAPAPEIVPTAFPVKTAGETKGISIAVNCTPLGGWHSAEASPLPKNFDFAGVNVYYDLNYNDNNQAVSAARRAGTIAIDGSSMLVSQAIKSFEIWTGQSVAFEPIFEAVFGSSREAAPRA